MQERFKRNAVGGQIFERQIDAVAPGILGHVAQNIGELEGDARLFGQLLGAGIRVAEDANADQANDRGHQIAVTVKTGEGGVGGGRIGCSLIEVHGHAGH
jgi:uncharacterized low-complexity protein